MGKGEKSGTDKHIVGKENLPNFLTRANVILLALAYGEMPLTLRKQLERRWGMSKQLFSDDIHRMIGKGWLQDENPFVIRFKFYKVTELGRTVLAEWESTEKRKLYKIENARYIVKIKNREHLYEFLKKPEYQFQGKSTLNNVVTYYGRIKGWAVAIYEGKEITLVVTPAPLYAKDMITGHHKIVQAVLDFLNDLNKKWLFDFTIPTPTTHRQYTISDSFASAILDKTNGSQVKMHTKDGLVSIDQSYGTEPRIEFEDVGKAQEYLEMPDQLRIINDKINKLLQSQTIRDNALNRIVDLTGKNSEAIDKLTSLIGGKLDEQVTKPAGLNSLSSQMFK